MTQLTFEAFEEGEEGMAIYQGKLQNPGTHGGDDTMLLVLILKDLNVAWNDRDWYLHSQDLVYLDEELASILVERGIARELNIGGIEQ